MKSFLAQLLALAAARVSVAQEAGIPAGGQTVVVTNFITPTGVIMPPAEATACGSDLVCPTSRITEYIDVYNSTVTTTSINVIPTLSVINQTYIHVNVIVKESYTSTFANCLTNATVSRDVTMTETLYLNSTSTRYAFVPTTIVEYSTLINYVNTTANCVKPEPTLGVGPGQGRVTAASTAASATPRVVVNAEEPEAGANEEEAEAGEEHEDL